MQTLHCVAVACVPVFLSCTAYALCLEANTIANTGSVAVSEGHKDRWCTKLSGEINIELWYWEAGMQARS